MPSVESHRLLLVDEVAAALRVSRSEVYALVRRGMLPAVRIGRAVRLDEVALRDFIASGGARRPANGGGVVACPDRGQA